jgi:two-component system, LytTR family, response regulator
VKLRTIIVDDERIARQRLRGLLAKENGLEIVAECADGVATVQAVREHLPDLVFLDIKMPGMDGFDVVEALDDVDQPAIVFVTAFDKHAVHAFETCALDYLLKPVSAARLAKTLARVRDHLERSGGRSAAARPKIPSDQFRRFSVRSGQRTSFIAPEEIDWIEADGNYAILHVGTQNHLLRETMATLETRLPAREFVRVSRSAILHLNRVKEIQTHINGHHSAFLSNGQRVVITRGAREIGKRVGGV